LKTRKPRRVEAAGKDAYPAQRARGAQLPELAKRLRAAVPNPHVELRFDDPWGLLVAVILSAQSTDKRVNQVMPELLARWPGSAAMAKAGQEEVEQVIRSTGFFRNKAKAIRGAAQVVIERFQGELPRTMDEMLELPGVARKTANVVLGAAYGVASGIVVDTHVARVSGRLALTHQTNPEKIESDLCRAFPREEWIRTGHRLVLHGRHLCTAREPRCSVCPLNEVCPSRFMPPKGTWQERAAGEAGQMASLAEGFRRADAGPS
jgi:endonuclease-3